MVWEIGEYYLNPETGRRRLRQEHRRAASRQTVEEGSSRSDEGGLLRRLGQSLFGSAETGSEKADGYYDRLKRMEAYEQAMSRMEELRMMRQSELKDISSKYSRNEQRGEELRGELSFAKHRGNTFMKSKIEGDLSGLRAQQVHLDFDYMNILRSMMDEAISGMKAF